MQLKEILKIIGKRWWLAVLVAVVAMMVAFFYSIAQPKVYETSVTILGKTAKPDVGLDNTVKSAILRLPTRLKSTDLASKIDQLGHFDLGADAIAAKITATPKQDQYYLLLTVADTDPVRAAAIANTAADIISEDNLETEALAPDDSKIFLDKTSKAPVPDRPSTPRTNLNTGAAGALGLIVGLILIFVVEFFDTSLRTPDDVERMTGLTVLGSIPAWKPKPSNAARFSRSNPNPAQPKRTDEAAGDA